MSVFITFHETEPNLTQVIGLLFVTMQYISGKGRAIHFIIDIWSECRLTNVTTMSINFIYNYNNNEKV